MDDQLIGQEQFLDLFADEFDRPRESLTLDTRIEFDLGFDSLEWFELAIFLEMLIPFDIPPDIDWDTVTIGFIYSVYCQEHARQILDL